MRVLRAVWFPLALVGLLALAIPVLILVILNLVGQAGAVNEWLLNHFNVTFAPPLGLVLIVLLVVPAIILLYFLKLKRKPLAVPSTFLWRKSIEEGDCPSIPRSCRNQRRFRAIRRRTNCKP